MKLGKKLCRTVKKSFSLVLALTIMLSVCAVSGTLLNVFAATSSGQKIYINLTKNKEWKDFSSVTYRFADDDGMVLDTGTVSKNSSGVFLKPLHHPVQQELSFLPGLNLLFPIRLLQKIFAVSIFITVIPIMKLMHILG